MARPAGVPGADGQLEHIEDLARPVTNHPIASIKQSPYAGFAMLAVTRPLARPEQQICDFPQTGSCFARVESVQGEQPAGQAHMPTCGWNSSA